MLPKVIISKYVTPQVYLCTRIMYFLYPNTDWKERNLEQQ